MSAQMNTDWMTSLKSITLHVAGESWPLWAPGASEEYRAARRALVEAELALRDQAEAVAARRRALPSGPVVRDYELTEGPLDLSAGDGPSPVRLSELFGVHDELIVYHLMFHPDDDAACPMCSLWVDGLHGVSHHITRRAALAVIARAPIDKLRGWGRRRGWQGLRLVSAGGTSLTTDLGTEGSRGGQVPSISVFTRHGEEIRHQYIQTAGFPERSGDRGLDLLSPVWNAFDLLPSGRDDWFPDNTYPGATRSQV
jgi:predicted dithiol-disulfide oxidoreductase (DUF899 family)